MSANSFVESHVQEAVNEWNSFKLNHEFTAKAISMFVFKERDDIWTHQAHDIAIIHTMNILDDIKGIKLTATIARLLVEGKIG